MKESSCVCRDDVSSRASVQAPGRQAVAAQQGPVASGTGHAGVAPSGPPSSGPSSIRTIFSGLGGLLGAASLGPPKVLCSCLTLCIRRSHVCLTWTSNAAL